MPVKRRAAKLRQFRLTPEAVEAYRKGDFAGLHLALGLPPWAPSPLDYNDPGPFSTFRAKLWKQSRELRAELEAAK